MIQLKRVQTFIRNRINTKIYNTKIQRKCSFFWSLKILQKSTSFNLYLIYLFLPFSAMLSLIQLTFAAVLSAI